MQYTVDFHLHSRFSRAVSPSITLPLLAQSALQKGLDVLSVSDFTHPKWFGEVTGQLEERSEGVYGLKIQPTIPVSFIFATEISCIYRQAGKLRRVHNLIFAPSAKHAEQVSKALSKKGAKLVSDGRPVIGLSARDLLELILEVSEKCFLIPCHVWTPHFGVYGSASGFDSLEACFLDLAPLVYGIETGISSDPAMNWQVKELEERSILSFSDAHSLPKMGREATVLELSQLSYDHILSAIKRESSENNVAYTIEYYPEEGKYHYSGHRKCNISVGPGEIRNGGNICPKCGKKLTEGVLYRLQELANMKSNMRQESDAHGVVWLQDVSGSHPPFVRLVPLLEVISKSQRVGVGSKKVQLLFQKILENLGSELEVMLRVPLVKIARVGGEKLASDIGKVRCAEIEISPGFDGEYGKVTLSEAKNPSSQQLGFEL